MDHTYRRRSRIPRSGHGQGWALHLRRGQDRNRSDLTRPKSLDRSPQRSRVAPVRLARHLRDPRLMSPPRKPPPPPPTWGAALLNRSTGEIIVLLLAVTICIGIGASTIFLGVIEIIDPSIDTSQPLSVVSDTVNTLIGVMAGFLAGRTEAKTGPQGLPGPPGPRGVDD